MTAPPCPGGHGVGQGLRGIRGSWGRTRTLFTRGCEKARLTMQPLTPRSIPRTNRPSSADFWPRDPTSSAVHEELGFPRVTCYAWAPQAKSSPVKHEKLIHAGSHSRGYATGASPGLDQRSAPDWDQGITIIPRGRIYPIGWVVRYPKATIFHARIDQATSAVAYSCGRPALRLWPHV
jgi:hypothetical protein